MALISLNMHYWLYLPAVILLYMYHADLCSGGKDNVF